MKLVTNFIKDHFDSAQILRLSLARYFNSLNTLASQEFHDLKQRTVILEGIGACFVIFNISPNTFNILFIL